MFEKISMRICIDSTHDEQYKNSFTCNCSKIWLEQIFTVDCDQPNVLVLYRYTIDLDIGRHQDCLKWPDVMIRVVRTYCGT